MVRKLNSKNRLGFVMLLLLGLSTLSPISFGDPMAVKTDKESYSAGEHVAISGKTDPNESVNVVVRFSGTTVFEATVMASQEGVYSVTFLLLSAQPGEYTVHASTTKDDAETVFSIVGGDCTLAHNLLEILSASRLKTKDLLNELLGDDPGPFEEASERLRYADEAAEEAHELFEEGRCGEASVKATEALRLYSEAIKLAEETKPEPEEDDQNEKIEMVLELRDAIRRVHAHLLKLNFTSREFERKGFDVSQVDALIEEALKMLVTADEVLEEGEIQETKDLITRARHLLEEAMTLIQELNEVNTIEKAKKFLTETEGRLDNMEERITNTLGNLGVSAQVLEAVGLVFEEAKRGIEDVKTLLDSGDIDGAMFEFKEVFDEADEGLEMVEEFDGSRVEILDKIEELEAHLKFLIEKVKEIREAGHEVPELEAALEKVKALLGTAVENVEKGYIDAAEDFVEKIGYLIDDIEREIKELIERIRSKVNEEERKVTPDDSWNTEEVPDEYTEMMIRLLKELEMDVLHFAEWIKKLAEEGHETWDLVSHIEMARKLLGAAWESLEKGDVESTKILASELEEQLNSIERAVKELLENATVDEPPVDKVIPVEEEPCDDEVVKLYWIALDELEEAIAYLENAVEELGEDAAKLKTYVEMAKKMLALLFESKPCEDSTSITLCKLEELVEYIETEVKLLIEKLDAEEKPSEEEEPERVIHYYILKIDEEMYGKFEFMVVKPHEGGATIVFEDGIAYDSFVEWILSGVNETYEPKSGRVISVDWSGGTVVEFYFEDAIPVSWNGTGLDSVTGESHPMLRLELTAII